MKYRGWGGGEEAKKRRHEIQGPRANRQTKRKRRGQEEKSHRKAKTKTKNVTAALATPKMHKTTKC